MHCASCGFENPEGMKFCGECGTALHAAKTPAPANRNQRQGGITARQVPRSAVPTMLTPSLAAAPDAERRQLTVLFFDLVGSTALSAQLDPEELHDVVWAYQETCTDVIRRYEGQIAQHLGDGLLVYFGYPVTHEDDARRAIHAGLGILAELQDLNRRLSHPLQVRIGIHTGQVVVGEIGSGAKREVLAIGETPNLAARLQGLAEPDTVVSSAATQRLVQGLFDWRELGLHEVKGLATPLPVYQVLGESALQSRFEVAVRNGLTPLVGREQEVGLLVNLWEQAKSGEGQVVLLSGEPGVGKSRLLQVLTERLTDEIYARVECRCSPFYQNTALYPIIEHVQRLLRFTKDDTHRPSSLSWRARCSPTASYCWRWCPSWLLCSRFPCRHTTRLLPRVYRNRSKKHWKCWSAGSYRKPCGSRCA